LLQDLDEAPEFERETVAPAFSQDVPNLDTFSEIGFTRSLLALSKVRSLILMVLKHRERRIFIVESLHRVQSKFAIEHFEPLIRSKSASCLLTRATDSCTAWRRERR